VTIFSGKCGRVPKWTKGTDCKSVIRRFESDLGLYHPVRENRRSYLKSRRSPQQQLFFTCCGYFESEFLTLSSLRPLCYPETLEAKMKMRSSGFYSICGSLGFALAISVQSHAATLVADYQLQDTYASSVGTIGPLAVVGNAADISFDDGQNVDGNTQTVVQLQTNYADPDDGGAGLQAQVEGYLDPTNYSVVMLGEFNVDPDLVATKVFDFKNLSADDGLYINDTTGFLYFNGVATAVGATPVLTGAYAQIVLTRDSSDDEVTVYVNGSESFDFTDTSGLAILGDTTNPSPNAYLTVYKDDATGIGGQTVNETSVGDLARLRLYDGVLTPTEVANLPTTIPEPVSAASMLLGGILLLRRSRGRA
jgi:hypothetical protein